jgi:hypothetical protein
MNKATDSLMEFVETGKTSFSDLASSIIKDLLRIMLQAQMSNITKGIFGSASGGSGSGIFGSLWGAVSGSVFHDGGVVGESSAPSRIMPAYAFAGAPRFHNGLAADEFPAILQHGERVLSKKEVSQGGGGSITVNVPVSGISDKSMINDLKNSIEQTVVSVIKRHS